jgi:hypothetical protein
VKGQKADRRGAFSSQVDSLKNRGTIESKEAVATALGRGNGSLERKRRP